MKMNKKQIAALAVMATISLAGCSHSSDENTQQSNSTANVEVPTENISEGIYEIKNTPSDEAVDETLYAKIATLNAAADKYYKANFDDIISAYGIMTSIEDSYQISASKIVEGTELADDTNLDTYVDVLLIRPSDLASFDGADVKDISDKQLKAFTAYHTTDGYIVSSSKDNGAILTTDRYKSLLGMYATDHGNIVLPVSTQEEYLDIVASVPFDDNSFDVKYVAHDDLYAVVVIGGLTNQANIKEYMLVQKPGGWSVAIDGLESEASPLKVINSSYPDFDSGILPNYTIASYGTAETGFDSYVQQLISAGQLSQSDLPITYSCGAGRFIYFELNSGKKYIGYVDENKKLTFHETDSVNSAVSYMTSVEDVPPLFILKYN
jgi:hypothetical protein